MKYFLDFEFIEGFHKPLFGKRRHFIDMISIGIVAENGREYSAISSEYSYKDADDWVKENVIHPLYRQTVHGDKRNYYHPDTFQQAYGKKNSQIAKEIVCFIAEIFTDNNELLEHRLTTYPPEFYGYYSDYDWVLFCSLFGRMIDLPKGFPMYCIDLKQTFDEKQRKWFRLSDEQRMTYCMDKKLYSSEIDLKNLSNYPKQSNEHIAINDAIWNKELYKFLQTL